MANERWTDKNHQPSNQEILDTIGGPVADAWSDIRSFLITTYELEPEIKYAGVRYGWCIPHKKSSRPICDLYPECGSFTVLVVLGKKEVEAAFARLDEFGTTVRKALTETPSFHDGRWLWIRVSDPAAAQRDIQDIEQLLLIKRKPARKKTA